MEFKLGTYVLYEERGKRNVIIERKLKMVDRITNKLVIVGGERYDRETGLQYPKPKGVNAAYNDGARWVYSLDSEHVRRLMSYWVNDGKITITTDMVEEGLCAKDPHLRVIRYLKVLIEEYRSLRETIKNCISVLSWFDDKMKSFIPENSDDFIVLHEDSISFDFDGNDHSAGLEISEDGISWFIRSGNDLSTSQKKEISRENFDEFQQIWFLINFDDGSQG